LPRRVVSAANGGLGPRVFEERPIAHGPAPAGRLARGLFRRGKERVMGREGKGRVMGRFGPASHEAGYEEWSASRRVGLEGGLERGLERGLAW